MSCEETCDHLIEAALLSAQNIELEQKLAVVTRERDEANVALGTVARDLNDACADNDRLRAALDAVLVHVRCAVTGNQAGTDTVAVGAAPDCLGCAAALRARAGVP